MKKATKRVVRWLGYSLLVLPGVALAAYGYA